MTDCTTTAEMQDRAREVLKEMGCEPNALLKIVLKGMVDVSCEKDLTYFLSAFRQNFFFVKVYDETTLKVEIEDYLLDMSLKGEFVRQVMEDESIGEDDKKVIIRYGLQAIAGEEVQ